MITEKHDKNTNTSKVHLQILGSKVAHDTFMCSIKVSITVGRQKQSIGHRRRAVVGLYLYDRGALCSNPGSVSPSPGRHRTFAPGYHRRGDGWV